MVQKTLKIDLNWKKKLNEMRKCMTQMCQRSTWEAIIMLKKNGEFRVSHSWMSYKLQDKRWEIQTGIRGLNNNWIW